MSKLQRHKLTGDVSRCGEYSFVRRHLFPDTPEIIVDLGAFGKQNSNSWNFIQNGWKGLLVEPQPGLAEACRHDFNGDFEVVQKAVDNVAGTATLQLYKVAGWASLVDQGAIRARALKWSDPRRRGTIEVEVVTLPTLLEEHQIPHRFGVLSIDCEGVDQRIAEHLFASPWRPDILLIETCDRAVPAAAGYKLLHHQPDQQIWKREESTT